MWNWIRNLDIRKVAGFFSILTGVEALIAHGDVNLAGLSPSTVDIVKVWCGNFVVMNQVLLGSHVLTAAKWPEPPAPAMPKISPMAVIAFLIGAAALLGASSVRAADFKLPAKAPQLGNYASGGCGFYYGLNTMGGGGSINGPVGATVIQGDIGATIGYGCPIGTTPGAFWFAEGNFDFANINGSQNGLALSGPAHFEQRLGAGGPISSMLSLFPGLSNGLSVPALPALPAGITAGPSYPFLFVSLHEEDVSAQIGATRNTDWLISNGFGIGLQSRLSNNVVAETAAQWVLRSNGLSVGPNKVGFGNGAEVSFTLKY